MTVRSTTIIGASFGDEGKGLITDYCSGKDTTVIRFNGGAQAGHTVVHGENRHVFHHFGSGTFKGASTFLSRFFISNPIVFMQELQSLHNMGYFPQVIVDPNSLVTTPWDMIVNQIVEKKRGSERHGSCGIGINETIKRNEKEEFKLLVRDLRYDTCRDVLENIQKKWFQQRMEELQIVSADLEEGTEKFLEYCNMFLKCINIGFLPENKNLVFEGAQGLLLDQNHRYFPFVTHSATGLENCMKLANDFSISEMDVIYVTRAYTTRHGKGPFQREENDLIYEDKTNLPNPWQGALRFGHLDIDLLQETISNDRKKASIPCRFGTAITCLDQVGNDIKFWMANQKISTSLRLFLDTIQKAVESDFSLVSFGPSEQDVHENVLTTL